MLAKISIQMKTILMHRTKNSFGWRLYGSSCNPEHCFDCLENRLVTNNETVNIRNTGTRWNTPEYDGTRWNTETPKHRNTRTSLNTVKYSNNNNNNNNISNNNISNNNISNNNISNYNKNNSNNYNYNKYKQDCCLRRWRTLTIHVVY